jgi:hypothetical protein
MKPRQSRKCLHCQELFKPDSRNGHHQKYCTSPACRKASKKASNKKWLAKPENTNYHSGPSAVTRVQEWRKLHPDYRLLQKEQINTALQDVLNTQVIDFTQENTSLSPTKEDWEAPSHAALQDFILTQPHVFIGLVAHLCGVTLQDDIAKTFRVLQELGEDITNGRHPYEFIKTGNLPEADTLRTNAVQLDRSTARAGSSP